MNFPKIELLNSDGDSWIAWKIPGNHFVEHFKRFSFEFRFNTIHFGKIWTFAFLPKMSGHKDTENTIFLQKSGLFFKFDKRLQTETG